jgi:hypothetical protein
MVFGMSLHTYTVLHVAISLLAIASGLLVMLGFLSGKRLDRTTALFLLTTALTSLTGFGFPFTHVTPAIKLGVLSLVVLAVAIIARYPLAMAGAWRRIYVISASLALYFNVFVLVVQSFEKVPALKALAPTQKEAPFAVAQIAVLVLFIVLTIFAVRGFRAEPIAAKSARVAA